MLIDEVLPAFDVTRVEAVTVAARPDEAYRAVLETDFLAIAHDDPLVRTLFALRGIPDRVLTALGQHPPVPAPPTMRLADLPLEGEWIRLGEDPGHEIVFGALGRFWNGPIRWHPSTASSFATLERPGSARIVANLAVHPYSADRVLVTYEARTAATDDAARRGLERYWRLVSPFVGMVMRATLRAVARHVAAPHRAVPAETGDHERSMAG